MSGSRIPRRVALAIAAAALSIGAAAAASAAPSTGSGDCSQRNARCAGSGEQLERAGVAARRTRIVRMALRLRGRGRPGPSYFVQVAVRVRVRVCGIRGRTVVRLTENSSPPGRNRPILVRKRRHFARTQTRRCQTLRFTYRLGDRFFGVSRYRVGVRARSAGRKASGVASRKVDTFD